MDTSTSRRFPRLAWHSSLWLLVPLVLSPLSFAHAYLDPGAGSYVIQMTIGLIFGTTYACRSFISRTLVKFKDWRTKNKKEA